MIPVRNLTVQYHSGDGSLWAAGLCEPWMRPMILSENAGEESVFRGKQAVLLCPGGWTPSERCVAEKAAVRAGLAVAGTADLAAAAARYYASADMPDSGAERMMVIDAEDRFTELSVIQIRRNTARTVISERVDESEEDGSEVIREARRILFRGLFEEGPVLLTGERDLTDPVKKALAEVLGRLITYRRRDVPLLGAAGRRTEEDRTGDARSHPPSGECLMWDGVFPARSEWPLHRLTEGQRRMVKTLWEAALRGQREVTCEPERAEDTGDVSRIWETLYHQARPEMDLMQDRKKIHVWITRCPGGRQMEVKYHFRRKRRELLQRVEQRAQEILDACADGRVISDREMLERIYQFVARNYRYADPLTAGGYPPGAYTVETLLKDGVCQGYALSMLYLLHRLQIPALFVSGDAESGDVGGHAWNLVQLANGTWRHMDVTWDLGSTGREEAYFLLDDIQMKARRHFWDAGELPRCE